MTRRAIFRQADVARAIAAAQRAGLPVARTEITSDGRIVLHHQTDAPASDPYEEWQRARAAKGGGHGAKTPR